MAPVVASFHLARYPTALAPVEMARFVTQRRHLAALDGLHFAKVLGTGRGTSMTVGADLRRWALLCVWDDHDQARRMIDASPVGRHWRRFASEVYHLHLEPLGGHGTWNGVEPFGELPRVRQSEGPVAVLTRATLRWRTMREFYRAVPSVDGALTDRPGLLASVGIGEAPVGRQATFSVWDSAHAIESFAYHDRAHREVIRATQSRGWFGEELFVRFRPVDRRGTWNGIDPLGPRSRDAR